MTILLPDTTPAPAADPTGPAVLDAAVATAIEHAIPAIESGRRLPSDLVQTLAAANLFRLYTPAEHGGRELDPVATCAVIEDVAALDASVAWCIWNGNCGFAAALLGPAPAEEVFGPGQPVGNSARVAGTATPTDGGYLLSGRWDLVSGSDHQPWIILFGMVLDGEGPRMVAHGAPDVRAFMVRREQFEIIDRWHVLGLRGTSSNEVVVQSAFVPEELAPAPFAASRIDRTLYRIPVFTTASCGVAAVSLGIARAAVEDLRRLAATKVSIRGPEPISTHAEVHAAVAEADISLRAARAALHDALAAVVARAAAAEPVELADRALVRAAMSHAARTGRAVTLRMFELASSSAIYEGHPLERRVRDALVAAQHVMVQPIWFEEAGRVQLGLEPTLPVL